MTEHHDKSSSHQDKPSSHQDKPSSHQDKPSSHQDKPSSHHDKSSSHQDKPSSHHKESSHHSSSSSPSKKNDETFTVSRVMFWQICSGILLVLLAISILTGGFGINYFDKESEDDTNEPIRVVLNPEQPQPVPSVPTVPTAPVAPPSKVEVDIGDSPFLGDEDAPVTIIEFSDFECPFCAKWYIDTKGQIDEQYIKMGKVKLVYMHYPLSFHPQAEPAALASECAYEQGKFWEFHDLIFENQRVISDANYKKWAADLGLDQAQFDDCYDSKKYQADVQDDFNKGQRAGVRGTPGFFVNGRLVSGAQPFSVFQQAIEAELNR